MTTVARTSFWLLIAPLLLVLAVGVACTTDDDPPPPPDFTVVAKGRGVQNIQGSPEFVAGVEVYYVRYYLFGSVHEWRGVTFDEHSVACFEEARIGGPLPETCIQ